MTKRPGKSTIQIDEGIKRILLNMKIVEREPYSDVIKRLIENSTDKKPIKKIVTVNDERPNRFYENPTEK